MPQFAANLSMMYTELPFMERFAAAAQDGFKGVEYLFPYAYPANEIAQQLSACGLQQVLFNAPAGGIDKLGMDAAWGVGDRGTACIPGRQAEFKAGIYCALEYAQALSCPQIHTMAGLLPLQVSHADGYNTYLDNLHWAVGQADKCGIDLLIEPINTRDMPGFFLNLQQDAHDVVERIGSPRLKVQMDLYHCQIMEGDLARKIGRYLPTGRVGHFQIAGVPERHEPDVGELNFPYLLQLIDTLTTSCGWRGWVGCEYKPLRGGQTGGTSAGLNWMIQTSVHG
jgi:hydroxypyruvate isomerase